MSASVEIDDRRAQVRFSTMPARVHASLSTQVTKLRLALEGLVKRKLSGEVLHVRTGNLRRSIFSDQTETAKTIVGRVAQSSDVPYGRIHEFGGKTSPHIILPVKGNVLAFVAGGKQVFAKRVNHPGSVMPERSYMRSSLREMTPEIVAGLTRAALEPAKE